MLSNKTSDLGKYLYILPVSIFIIIITIFPLIYSIYISTQDYQLITQTSNYIGTENFEESLEDKRFQASLITTLKIGIPSLFIETILGLSLALLLSSIKTQRGIITSLLATPVLIAPSAVAMSFKMLYTPQWGPINHILGMPFGEILEIDWLGNPQIAPIAVIIADVWQWSPFVMLIVLAGILSIPTDIYEASRIDGASGWNSFKYITLPLIRFPLTVAVILRAIDLFKLFDLPFVMSQGGPAGSTETVTIYTYLVGIRFFRVGYGAALSIMLLLVVIIVSRFLVKYTNK
jgi:multiple sugar transport system permease protein|tara:strand:+ start:620 stop:1489 length:870 start_codon:yes stop_codon:yes gene_type:complete